MPEIEIEDPNQVVLVHGTEKSSVTVALKGATIISWTMFSNELLYVSPDAHLSPADDVAIRGGIPIIFPQFNTQGSIQRHGFARNFVWEFKGEVAASEDPESGDIVGIFELVHNEKTLAIWPYKFRLQLHILVGMTYLQTSLHITNLEEEKDMSCHALFHTYLHTDDITRSVVTGLKGLSYTDYATDRSTQTDRNVMLPIVGEIDRTYFRHVWDEPAQRFREEEMLALGDGGNCDITLRATNLSEVVVWNPGPEKAKAIADMPDKDYKKFVCVELGQVGKPFVIKPSESVTCGQRLVLRILAKLSEHVRRTHAEQAVQFASQQLLDQKQQDLNSQQQNQ